MNLNFCLGEGAVGRHGGRRGNSDHAGSDGAGRTVSRLTQTTTPERERSRSVEGKDSDTDEGDDGVENESGSDYCRKGVVNAAK